MNWQCLTVCTYTQKEISDGCNVKIVLRTQRPIECIAVATIVETLPRLNSAQLLFCLRRNCHVIENSNENVQILRKLSKCMSLRWITKNNRATKAMMVIRTGFDESFASNHIQQFQCVLFSFDIHFRDEHFNGTISHDAALFQVIDAKHPERLLWHQHCSKVKEKRFAKTWPKSETHDRIKGLEYDLNTRKCVQLTHSFHRWTCSVCRCAIANRSDEWQTIADRIHFECRATLDGNHFALFWVRCDPNASNCCHHRRPNSVVRMTIDSATFRRVC